MTIRIILMILGWVCLILMQPSWAKTRIDFNGQMNFDQNELNCVLTLPVIGNGQSVAKQEPSNSVAVKVNKLNDNQYSVSIKFDHLKALSYDLSSEIKSTFDLQNNSNGNKLFVFGKLQSQYAMVDSKPIRDLSADFQIKDRKLIISGAMFGNVTSSGTIELASPFKLDLVFHLNEIEMPDFLKFWMTDNNYSSSGIVSGAIRASGTIDKVYLKGNLESTKGFVAKLEFDKFLLNAEGIFPNMQIAKSTISQPDGMVFILEGPIDLSDHDNFSQQIKELKISPIVNDSDQERAWTIRRLKGEEFATTEIKYMLRKDSINPTSNDNTSDVLGVERSLEF